MATRNRAMVLFLVEVALFELLVCPEMEPWFHFWYRGIFHSTYVATPCTKRCYMTPSLLYIGTLGIMLLNFDCVFNFSPELGNHFLGNFSAHSRGGLVGECLMMSCDVA